MSAGTQKGPVRIAHVHEAGGSRQSTRPPGWLNRLTLAVLRSPLHRLVDAELCELRYRGRRSGRRVALPVLYARDGDALVVLVGDAPDKRWWRNFEQPHPVQVRHDGRRSAGICRLLDRSDPRHPTAAAAYRRRHGMAALADDRLLLVEPTAATP